MDLGWQIFNIVVVILILLVVLQIFRGLKSKFSQLNRIEEKIDKLNYKGNSQQ